MYVALQIIKTNVVSQDQSTLYLIKELKNTSTLTLRLAINKL